MIEEPTAFAFTDLGDGIPAPKRKPKKADGSPTQRSLKAMRDRGFTVAVVEKWNPHARVRQDMYGFIDVLAIREGEIVGVQATSDSNLASRVTKIADHDNVAVVRKAGIRILVHGWKKVGGRWRLREVDCS